MTRSSLSFRLKAETTESVLVTSACRRNSFRLKPEAWPSAGFRLKPEATRAEELETVKKRLPMPSERPQSSVTSQPIVRVPLANVDQSKTKCPLAASEFEKPGNAAAMSARKAP